MPCSSQIISEMLPEIHSMEMFDIFSDINLYSFPNNLFFCFNRNTFECPNIQKLTVRRLAKIADV